jgi:hypothetical protein
MPPETTPDQPPALSPGGATTPGIGDPYDEAVSQFMFGGPVAETRGNLDAMARAYGRAFRDSGMQAVLGELGMHPDTAHLQQYIDVPPDFPADRDHSTSATNVDVLTSIFEAVLKGPYERDRDYEDFTGRWRKHRGQFPPELIPADAGAIRLSIANRARATQAGRRRDQDPEHELRWFADAFAASCTYLGVPHFMPRDYLGVLTGPGPDARIRANLHLPAPWVMVFHDPIPMRELADTPEQGAYAENHTNYGPGSAVIGAVLSAHDDYRLDDGWGWVLFAVRPRRDGDTPLEPLVRELTGREIDPNPPVGYAQAVQFDKGDHPAARYLLNVADVLANLPFEEPAELPPAARDSRSQLKRQAKTPEARDGAWHGVHVVRIAPPAPETHQRRTGATGTRGPLKFGTWRKAHPHRRRIGIRDEYGDLVGPVYGPDAVEGVTFTFFYTQEPRRRVREDLPLSPDALVYRLPESGAQAAGKRRAK